MFSFKDFITESIGSEEWNKSTLRAHLNDQHEHLKSKHEDIINHFHDKKKVDAIASSDELKIPVGSVKTIWNHLKAKRKESFGTSASKETKGEKLSRQLSQQKTARKEEFELDEAKEFTPKFDFRKKVQPNINAHLDDDKVAGAHTSITYHKQPTGEIHAHVSYRNISGRSSTGVGPEKHMKFLVNKDYSVTKMNEEYELDEVAKPKGVVDKKFGKPEAPSKSGFKTGQRVAHYRGMGKTLHGNVTNPDAVSGGTKGAMVKFEHGTEFVPHKELKDAGEYWKSEDETMRKERDSKVKKEEFEQIDEVSAELANKVVQARQSRLYQMRKEKGDFGAAKTPEYKKELSKVQKSSPIAQKKSTDEIRKKVSSMSADDHKRESDGYAKDADANRKRGWSNEEIEYTDPLTERIMVYKAFIERTAK